MSDINTDAREELAPRLHDAFWRNEDWAEAADALLDPELFARLAGLLGYVKADHEALKTTSYFIEEKSQFGTFSYLAGKDLERARKTRDKFYPKGRIVMQTSTVHIEAVPDASE